MKKRKVNIDRPPINANEISKMKNFKNINLNSTMAKSTLIKSAFFFAIAAVVAVVAIVGIWYFSSNDMAKNELTNKNEIHNDTVSINPIENEVKKIISPIKGLDVAFTTHTLNAKNGGLILLASGTKIIVPKNCFQDVIGKSIESEIEIKCREFRDAVDFFVAGIPMTYDSAGVRYQFESAGMIELQGLQDGHKIEIAKNKSITVEFASNYNGTDYNFYKFDTVKNDWSCLGKDKIKTPNKNSTLNSEEDYNIKLEVDRKKYDAIETKKQYLETEKDNAISKISKVTIEPTKPRKAIKEHYSFDIDFDQKDFPELAFYKGTLFEIGEENTNFSPELYKITWEDLLLKQGTKKNENYILTLKKGLKKYDFVVYPVYAEKDYDKALKSYSAKFEEYNTLLEKRKVEEKRIEEEYKAKVAELKRQQDELQAKWRLEQEKQFQEGNTTQKVIRMFTVNSFGIYNSDACRQIPGGIAFPATLTNEKGIELYTSQVYLVDKSKNALFSLGKNPMLNFTFNPSNTNMLWTCENGRLYWLKPSEFEKLKSSNSTVQLKLSRVDVVFNTTDEMKKYFGFL
jgi:hypothetical protein